MRYRDQPTVQVEERLRGDPEHIWALVTDIDLPARSSPELQRVEWLDGADGVVVGARFRGHNQNPDLGEWTTESEVVEVEPGRRWVWAVEGPEGTMATWGFEVDPGREAVTVRQFARMGPARSGLSIAIDAMPDKESRIVSHRLAQWREAMEANLAGLRVLVEGG
ncbi:SRPBCC family protein [Iamia majanohamensis]|uniref:SRPBCC family protein n=1 Tax=Iamia majanohamensis TaxID=467976 RepID=A0AAE9YBP2_9ACTN|nr:SRPBCC family protein [Iamia majanohamensis]WCO68148.1 SRPBCC family protein [Iamia majanohamensis]